MCFPVLLNDCAVYSGLNEVKEKSCWELLLILYQQLASMVLDLWEWVESYRYKDILIWLFMTEISSMLLDNFHAKHEVICKCTPFYFASSVLKIRTECLLR